MSTSVPIVEEAPGLVRRLGGPVLALMLACVLLVGADAGAVAIEPAKVLVLAGDDVGPPPDDDERWQPTQLPDVSANPVAWYRVEFEVSALDPGAGLWMLYLPYFYGGGRIWLNGEPLAAVLENSAERRVRWERPQLLPLPLPLLHVGTNVLHLRPVAAQTQSISGLPRLVVGTQDQLQPMFERRLLFVRTIPLVTVFAGSAVGLFVIYIWLRRRDEVLYGLFGVATLMWALRTTTFVVDTLPATVWPWWRLLYHATNGAFIVLMSLFALRLAGWYRPRIAQVLGAYWLLGPLLYLVAGTSAEVLVSKWWVAGLIPVGLSIVVFTAVAAWRERTPANVAILATVALGVLAGIHDYMLAWRSPWLHALLPDWSDHRVFLMHHGANLLLLVMGAVLTGRFVRSLGEAELANRVLEDRVAEREREIAANYQRIATLQRERAAIDERQRIMQDIHDGLGSTLFTSLSRAQRGALDAASTVETLRACIEEMRLSIEALASDEQDFRTALGNFLFRWEARLRDAGVTPSWRIDVPDDVLPISPHDTLQILRVLQEAMTNVLKHAHATRVAVALTVGDGRLRLQVDDDGVGPPDGAMPGGRGHANMRARAERLGARLEIGRGERGMRVVLEMPLTRG